MTRIQHIAFCETPGCGAFAVCNCGLDRDHPSPHRGETDADDSYRAGIYYRVFLGTHTHGLVR